jgi:fructokinase
MILCIGDALIDFLSVTPEQSLEDSLTFFKSPGGSALNCSVIARRLGANVAFCSALGTDCFGRYLIKFLGNAGIDTSSIISVDRADTGVAFASSPNGKVQFEILRGEGIPAAFLSEADLPVRLLEESSIMHLCSLLVYRYAPFKWVKSCIDYCHFSGNLLTFDPNVRPHAISNEDDARMRFEYILQRADLIKMSHEDCSWLYPLESLEAVCESLLLKQKARLVIVTRGEKGSMGAILRDGRIQITEVEATGVPSGDTVGAGDAFMAAVLYQLSSKPLSPSDCLSALNLRELGEILRFASCASYCVCQDFGALAGLTHKDQVEALLST